MQYPIPPMRKINFSFLKIVKAKCQQNIIKMLEIITIIKSSDAEMPIIAAIIIITAEKIPNPTKSFDALSTKKSFSSLSSTIKTNQAIKTINVKMYIVKSRRKKSKMIEASTLIRIRTIPSTRNNPSFFPLILCIILCRFLNLK